MDVGDLEAAFSNYEIPFISFTDFIRRDFPQEQEDAYLDLNHLHDWMPVQEDGAFGRLWEKMTDEVFHVLFGNRGFLLKFNIALAQFRQKRGDSPSPRYSIPQWVKRAVYFRENGKCALCKRDLSGLIAIDPKQHYDHIVPLKALGAKDPAISNFCAIGAICRKRRHLPNTSSVYDPWWK